jgi:hypothetical protein
VILAIFGVIGVLLGLFSVWLWFVAIGLTRNGIHTQGTITNVEVRKVATTHSRDRNYWCFPTIRFTTSDGRDIHAVSQTGFQQSRSPEIKEGATIAIVYRKDNPYIWSVDDWLSIYLAPTIVAVSSFVTLSVTLLMYVGKHPH